MSDFGNCSSTKIHRRREESSEGRNQSQRPPFPVLLRLHQLHQVPWHPPFAAVTPAPQKG